MHFNYKGCKVTPSVDDLGWVEFDSEGGTVILRIDPVEYGSCLDDYAYDDGIIVLAFGKRRFALSASFEHSCR